MVRPRLVEEGVPIYGPGSDETPKPVLADGMVTEESRGSGPQALPHGKVTSLQLAAQECGTELPRKKRAKTRAGYEVGGPTRPVKSLQIQPQSTPYQYVVPGQHDNNHHSHHDTQMEHQHVPMDDIGSYSLDHAMDHTLDHTMDLDGGHQYDHPASAVQTTWEVRAIPSAGPSPQYHPPAVSGLNPSVTIGGPVTEQPTVVQTSHTIGGDIQPTATAGHTVEKMHGVEDHGDKTPLVVLDGANVAHAYGAAQEGLRNSKAASDPDATGIQVAVDYFTSVDVRVLIVLPQYWFRSKPRPGRENQWNSKLTSSHKEVLNSLQESGLIVASPPADDDDAYALTIARREDARSLQRKGQGPGFVLSNDMFRDAQDRDTSGFLKRWLTKGRDTSTGPGRISYTFGDMGSMNDHGERILDFVPNPRHPLVVWIEGLHHRGLAPIP